VNRNFIETTAKLNKAFQTRCPQLYRAIFGKHYLLPQYRIADYENQDTLNRQIYLGLAIGGESRTELDARNAACTGSKFIMQVEKKSTRTIRFTVAAVAAAEPEQKEPR
jgi:hypothetical protein